MLQKGIKAKNWSHLYWQKENIKPYKVDAWKVKQTHNSRLNKDENYKDIHIWVRDCFNQVKEKLKLSHSILFTLLKDLLEGGLQI